MLQVPLEWPSAQFPCAVVRLDPLSRSEITSTTHDTKNGTTAASHALPKVEEGRSWMQSFFNASSPHSSPSSHTRYFLCRLVPCSAPRVHFMFSPVVLLPSSSMAERLTAQDCSTIRGESHRILLEGPTISSMEMERVEGGRRRAAGGSQGGEIHRTRGYRYSLLSSSASISEAEAPSSVEWSGEEALLYVWCPEMLYAAKTLTLTGPRLHTRMSTSHLSSALMGQWVATGATCVLGSPSSSSTALGTTSGGVRKNVTTPAAMHGTEGEDGLWPLLTMTSFSSSFVYEVTGVEMKIAGRRGIGWVGVQTKIRLNDAASPSPSPRISWNTLLPTLSSVSSASPLSPPPPPMGLEAAVRQVQEWIRVVAEQPVPSLACCTNSASPCQPRDENRWRRGREERGVSSCISKALLIRGPHGCGVNTVMDYCLQNPVNVLQEERKQSAWLQEENGMKDKRGGGGGGEPFHRGCVGTERGTEWNGKMGQGWRREVEGNTTTRLTISTTTLASSSAPCSAGMRAGVLSLGLQTLIWRPGQLSIPYVMEHILPRARVLLFRIEEASQWFPKNEPELAKTSLRLLEKDMQALREAVEEAGGASVEGASPERLRLAVMAVAHHYGTTCATSVLDPFFDLQLGLSLPTASERATLLSTILKGWPGRFRKGTDCFSKARTVSLLPQKMNGQAPLVGEESTAMPEVFPHGERGTTEEEEVPEWWQSWVRTTALSLVGCTRRQVIEEGKKYREVLRGQRGGQRALCTQPPFPPVEDDVRLGTAHTEDPRKMVQEEEAQQKHNLVKYGNTVKVENDDGEEGREVETTRRTKLGDHQGEKEDETNQMLPSSFPSTTTGTTGTQPEPFSLEDVLEAATTAASASHGRPLSKQVQWKDIGGLQEVKRELREALVLPYRYPEVYQRFHLTSPSGVLLYGPPGCAKTTLIKALIASEGIFSFLYLDSASVMSAYVGESERILRDVFQQAAQQAPCIIFFDEVEVLGGAREHREGSGGGGKGSGQRDARLLSTVLMEMDGFASSAAGRGVCFVGATNLPHLLDPALLRPGRLDRLIYIGLPDEEGRKEILSLYLSTSGVPDVSFLAAHTNGFTGADLKVLCSEALLEWLSLCSSLPEAVQTSTVSSLVSSSEHQLPSHDMNTDTSQKTIMPFSTAKEPKANVEEIGLGKEWSAHSDPFLKPSCGIAGGHTGDGANRSQGSDEAHHPHLLSPPLGSPLSMPHPCPVTTFFYRKIQQFSPTVYPSDALERFRRQAEHGKVGTTENV